MAKAVISSTYDDLYLWNIPLTTWCWNKLGVDVICFLPIEKNDKEYSKIDLALSYCNNARITVYHFNCPKYKESTYAQCSRLYGACLDLPREDVLIIGDVDMLNFRIPPHENNITIWGSDLVPDGQFPMCYATGTIPEWRGALKLSYGTLSFEEDGIMQYHVKPYQQCLDELLGSIEADHFRGNYWGKDQETLWQHTKDIAIKIPRARPGTQFAENRYDRDDAFLLDRLSPETIDYHMPRPGYEENNFNQILTVLKYHFPQEDFSWLVNYNEEYKKLL